MGVNSQRLLILVIAINIVIGLVTGIYYHPTAYRANEQDVITSITDDTYNTIKGEITNSQPTNDQIITESSYGNPITLGGEIIKSYFKGLVFQPIVDEDNTTLNKVNYGLTLFRGLMSYILILEIIFIFKNRKTS